MRDEEKRRIISLAIADNIDDEGQDPPTTPPLTQYSPQRQQLSNPQHPSQRQHPALTQDPLQLRSQPHLPSPLQVPQASISQSLRSLLESINPLYHFFFFVILAVFLSSRLFSQPTSRTLRPAAESVLVDRNLSVSAEPLRLSTKLFLPHPINAKAHKAILDQTGWEPDEQLILLFEYQKLVSSSLQDVRDGMQWANQHLVSIFCNGKFDKSSISKAINHFDARLSTALREIDKLAALYSSLEECYKVFDAVSAGALLTDRMMPRQEFAIKWQPRSLRLVNVDFHEWYEVPWEQKVKRREDARQGLAVFDQEFRRVQQTKSLFGALQSVTRQCASELSEIEKPNAAKKVWERIWSCYKTSNIGKLWTGLLDLAKEDEDALGLELTTEWCRS